MEEPELLTEDIRTWVPGLSRRETEKSTASRLAGSPFVGRRIFIYIEVASGPEIPGSFVGQLITSTNRF
jgi:hypothetical protein